MANPIKGEVTFTAGEEDYTLVFSINAICALEDRLGKSMAEIGEALGKSMSIRDLRTIVWAGLQEHHRCTEEDAGMIMTALGMAKVGEVIGKAFTLAFPEAKGNARPPKAAAGTGKTA